MGKANDGWAWLFQPSDVPISASGWDRNKSRSASSPFPFRLPDKEEQTLVPENSFDDKEQRTLGARERRSARLDHVDVEMISASIKYESRFEGA